MEYLVYYGPQLFILVLFPFLGLALEIGLSSKTIRIISIEALVILIPILFGYNYTLSYRVYPRQINFDDERIMYLAREHNSTVPYEYN